MHAPISTKKQQVRIAALQAEIDALQEELGQDIDADQMVKDQIRLLHRYNEAKDAAQILIGRLAILKDTTVRQIHKDFDLPQND